MGMCQEVESVMLVYHQALAVLHFGAAHLSKPWAYIHLSVNAESWDDFFQEGKGRRLYNFISSNTQNIRGFVELASILVILFACCKTVVSFTKETMTCDDILGRVERNHSTDFLYEPDKAQCFWRKYSLKWKISLATFSLQISL